MRITSDFFVSALIRRVMGEGGFAALSRRGSPEAGAIFIVVDRLDGTHDFYGPAPQAWFEDTPDGRLFERVLLKASREDIAARLASEERMDPDLWVVDIEAADGHVDLPLVESDEETSVAGTAASSDDPDAPPPRDPNSYFKS